jgi:hypothetical protein
VKKVNKGGRPKEIEGKTIRVTYNLKLAQADFIAFEAEKMGVSESEIMRCLIDYVIAQYEAVRRTSVR